MMFLYTHHCKLIATIKVITIYHIPHLKYFCFLNRTIKLYSLSKFQIYYYYMVLLTIVTVLYTRYPELIHPA